jgi:sulfonate transport system permease protein
MKRAPASSVGTGTGGIATARARAVPSGRAPSAVPLRPAPWQGVALGLAVPVLLALVWEAAVALELVSRRLMPPPSQIAATLTQLAVTGDLWLHVTTTTWRVAMGFVLGTAAGTVIGAIAGYSGLARQLLDPTLQGLRAVPSIAWVPLFILWLGIFEESKVALIAVGVFFPVYLGVMGEIVSVDRKIVEVGRVFRLSGPALVRRILLPAILPAYVLALRAGLGLGWMFVVAAEFMGAAEGLGYLLVDGQQLGKPDQIIAAILTFAVLGKLSDAILVAVTRPFLRWQDVTGSR